MENEIMLIFSGNAVEAEFVAQILNDNGIVATLKNQLMATIAPWQVSAGGLNPVEVEIFTKDKEKALALIAEFKNKNIAT